jgi:hypothetical protein
MVSGCPLWVISGQNSHQSPPCPLYPRKRTCAVQLGMSALGQKRTSAKIICLLCELHQRERGASIWAAGLAERFTYFKMIVALPMSLTTREVLRLFVMAITSCIICSYNVVVAMPAYCGGDNEVQVSNQLNADNCRHHRGCAD